MLLFYTTQEVYTKFGMVSIMHRIGGILNINIRAIDRTAVCSFDQKAAAIGDIDAVTSQRVTLDRVPENLFIVPTDL